MEPQTTTVLTHQLSLNDLVFENRNKAYGAYQLRQLYNQHLGQGLLFSVAIFVVLFSLPTVLSKFGTEEIAMTTVVPKDSSRWVEVKLPDPKEMKQATADPEAAPKAPVKTIKDVTYKVVDESKQVDDEIPTQYELKNAVAGLTTSEGPDPSTGGNPMPNEGTGNVDGTGSGEESATPTPSFFTVVEKMPEFEGGLNKLMSYLSRNIKYPRAALSQGIEGTVILSFVVMPSGEIAQIEVLKGLGFGTEEEAIRVVSKMPRWKPGIQNGRAVPVKMTLPIRLELN